LLQLLLLICVDKQNYGAIAVACVAVPRQAYAAAGVISYHLLRKDIQLKKVIACASLESDHSKLSKIKKGGAVAAVVMTV
jgi:hypothetical protein